MPLKRIKRMLERFELTKAAEYVLLIVSLFLIADALAAFLGGPYLTTHVGAFLSASTIVVLSDLLFIEGALIFAVGTFIALASSMRRTNPPPEPAPEEELESEQIQKRPVHPIVIIIFIGIVLIGLSMVVGLLEPA
jgi:hypothetical protein